jgi:hypothetical protein
LRRITSACLEQTLKFESEGGTQTYINRLNRKGVKYKIVDKQTGSDNFVTVKIIRDYSTYPVGDYLN